jgi:hypothetical protein
MSIADCERRWYFFSPPVEWSTNFKDFNPLADHSASAQSASRLHGSEYKTRKLFT